MFQALTWPAGWLQDTSIVAMLPGCLVLFTSSYLCWRWMCQKISRRWFFARMPICHSQHNGWHHVAMLSSNLMEFDLDFGILMRTSYSTSNTWHILLIDRTQNQNDEYSIPWELGCNLKFERILSMFQISSPTCKRFMQCSLLDLDQPDSVSILHGHRVFSCTNYTLYIFLYIYIHSVFNLFRFVETSFRHHFSGWD